MRLSGAVIALSMVLTAVWPVGSAAAPRCMGEAATIVGTGGGDHLIGGPGRDVIVAGGGDDVIEGRGGSDLICAGAGDDVIADGSGNDRVRGEAGRDMFVAGTGDDQYGGGPGVDTVDFRRADSGVDASLVEGRAEVGSEVDDLDRIERLVGTRFSDRLVGDAGRNTLLGGPGHDDLDGRGGVDRAIGGSGLDACSAERTSRCERTIDIAARSAWGATAPRTESMVEHSGSLQWLTVHHDGGALGTWGPVRYRGWQTWHMSGHGWGDLAYHFIIGRDGTIYEGRDIAYRGDTATEYDPDRHLLVVVEGNFDLQRPADAQLRSLEQVLAWAAEEFGVSPTTIAGHRDHSNQTSCPGGYLHPLIASGQLEAAVERLMAAGGVSTRS